jgi:hypothetical protein
MVARRSPKLLALILAASGVVAFLSTSFVSGFGNSAAREVTILRAEKTEFKLPKPDTSLLNSASRIGQSFDQDKRGNMWAVDQQVRLTDKPDAIPAPVFLLLLVVLTIGSIIFFAQLTGQSNDFGGAIGDGSTAVSD